MKLAIATVFFLGCAGQPPDDLPSVDAATADSAAGADAAIEIDAPTTNFSFFVTSTSGPTGGDFRANAADTDGLAGADAFCAAKAAAGVPASAGKLWRAYLSTTTPLVNARERIGAGPWFNKNGVMVASDVTNLHDPAVNITGVTAVDETGATVPANQHDIVTGTLATGMAAPNNCNNWTSSAATGVTAAVGHHDHNAQQAWNLAHDSQGCSAAAFVATGGRGSIYCFAAN